MNPPEEIEQDSDNASSLSSDTSDETFEPAIKMPSFRPLPRLAIPHTEVGTAEYDWNVLYVHYKQLYLALKERAGLI